MSVTCLAAVRPSEANKPAFIWIVNCGWAGTTKTILRLDLVASLVVCLVFGHGRTYARVWVLLEVGKPELAQGLFG